MNLSHPFFRNTDDAPDLFQGLGSRIPRSRGVSEGEAFADHRLLDAAELGQVADEDRLELIHAVFFLAVRRFST